MPFEVGATYTREQVQDLLGVPDAQRDGAWDTGYNRFGDQLYVFCNVGSAGRTGHDYDNHWEGDELVWHAKTGTHVRQPLMRRMVAGEIPVHLFWREDSRVPRFNYAGPARPSSVEETSPVTVRWAFGSPRRAQPSLGAVGASEQVTLGELLSQDGRLFAKSEFGPVHEGWPAVSFSSRAAADDISRDFRRGQDFVLFVGTSDQSKTVDPDHRSRVVSAVSFEPRAPIPTHQIVPEASWRAAVLKHGVRWEWSLPVTDGWDLLPFRDAREVMPRTYARLGQLASLGRCVPVDADDLPGLLACPVARKPLAISEAVKQAVAMNPSDADLRRTLSQLAASIQLRIEQSGKERGGVSPLRKGPNLSDLILLLNRKWEEQGGRCLLCEMPIPLKPANRLLQMSPDRIDSDDKVYGDENLHLTHLGCNLAKNSASMEDWRGFLAHIRERVDGSARG